MNGRFIRECPRCDAELGTSPDPPGVYWCDECEKEYWDIDGEWFTHNDDGEPRHVNDPSVTEGEQ